MVTKQCKTCNEIKPENEFGIHRKSATGSTANFRARENVQLNSSCRPCKAKIQKAWRNANPGYWKKINRKVHTGKVTKYPLEDRFLMSAIRSRFGDAKQRNKRNKVPTIFTITPDYLYSVWMNQEGKCALTGTIMSLEKNTPLTLSLDKVIPEKGYIEGNVQWLCWAVNRAKGDLNTIDFYSLCKAVIEQVQRLSKPLERAKGVEYTQVSGSAQHP